MEEKLKTDHSLYAKLWAFKENADKFLKSKSGRYFRFSLLTASVCVYPVIKVFSSGPFLNALVKWRVNLDTELPEHLKKTINEQTFIWLEKVGKIQSDNFCTFSCQRDAAASLDSISLGTSSFATGAQIALPFYAKFRTQDEAMAYAKEHFEPFKVLGKITCIVWESKVGRQLLSTFVLSDEAIAFLVARDLFSVKETYLLTRDALSWFCFTLSYMCCFYILHTTFFRDSFLSFALLFPILFALSVFTATQWNKLAIYMNEKNADLEAAKMSQRHTRGGREFYTKFLFRNRILRDLVEGGDKIFTEVGDVRKAISEYVMRYDDIGAVRSKNEQLTISMEGDDIPGEI